jgi:hypothetical protein
MAEAPNRQAQWQAAHPKARWAHIALQSDLRRGIVKRKPCVVCGAEKVDGHHPDYDRPAHVVWMCRRHHNNFDAQQRSKREQS